MTSTHFSYLGSSSAKVTLPAGIPLAPAGIPFASRPETLVRCKIERNQDGDHQSWESYPRIRSAM